MVPLKSMIALCVSKRLLIPVLMALGCFCLLVSSCRNQTTRNYDNGNGASTPKSVPSAQTAASQEVDELKKLNPEDLLKEIRARERHIALDLSDTILERQSEGIAHQPFLANPKTDPALAKYSSLALTIALLDEQKGIYGQDNRKDIFLVTSDPKVNASADAVVSLFQSSRLVPLEDGTKTKIVNKVYATEYRLCDTASPVEPYLNQPCSAFCSGVLIASDIVATAGHCIGTPPAGTPPLSEIRFIFGYRMRDEDTAEMIIDNRKIYAGKEIIKRVYNPKGPDWAIVRLDRPV